MKWRYLLFAVLLGLLMAGAVVAEQEEGEEDILSTLQSLTVGDSLPDLQEREIRVAIMNTYPPFNRINADGRGEGWDYDVLGELCERLNCTLLYEEYDWPDLIPSVRYGITDMAANGITITEERREFLAFSEPYIVLRQLLLVRINETRFDTVAEFVADDTLTVTALVDTTNAAAAYELLGEDSPRVITTDGTFDDMMLALSAGETDAVVMDDLAARRYVSDYSDVVRFIDEPITTLEELGFVFTVGSDLVEPFNAALETIRVDGTLDVINTRWFLGQE